MFFPNMQANNQKFFYDFSNKRTTSKPRSFKIPIFPLKNRFCASNNEVFEKFSFEISVLVRFFHFWLHSNFEISDLLFEKVDSFSLGGKDRLYKWIFSRNPRFEQFALKITLHMESLFVSSGFRHLVHKLSEKQKN
jgi:hypothetical protein